MPLPSDREYRPTAETPLWFRPVFPALRVAAAGRRGVTFLRVIVGVVVATTVIGNYLRYFDEDSRAADGGLALSLDADRSAITQFFSAVTFPLAIAGFVLGLSYVVQHSVSRLDLDLVRAHQGSPDLGDD